MKMANRLKAALLALALITAHPAWSAGFLEKEVYFSEADIQAELDKRGTLERRYGNMLSAALLQPPKIRLGEPAGRATLTARVNVSILGAPAVPVDMEGTAGIRYDDKAKAFFLDKPVATAVHSAALSPEAAPFAQQAVSQLMNTYFRSKPVYVLRQDGSAEELAARWLLRSVRIEPGRVAAVLSPD